MYSAEYYRCIYWVRSERSPSERGIIATFNVDHKSGRELRQYLGTVASQCSPPARSSSAAVDNAVSTTPGVGADCPETTHVADRRVPVVIILDDLHHITSPALLADAFNALLGLPLHDWYSYEHVFA